MNSKEYLEIYTGLPTQATPTFPDGIFTPHDFELPEKYYRNHDHSDCYIDTLNRSDLLKLIESLKITDTKQRVTTQQLVLYLQNLRTQISEQKIEIEYLNKEVANYIARLNSEIDSHIAQQRKDHEKFDYLVRDKDAEIDCLKSQISSLQATIKELFDSTSWQVTAPIRSLSRTITKIKQGAIHDLRINYWVRAILSNSAHTVYRCLPLSSKRKLQIKDTAYSLFGPMIRYTRSYQHWAGLHGLPIKTLTKSQSDAIHMEERSAGGHYLPKWFYQERSEDYIAHDHQIPILTDIKLIAFYLPQFHPIPENDRWWGKGFTEWANVTKAKPQFSGHYQPHLPSDLGFYDLRIPEVQRQQITIAKQYGIYGFCYHHYWFGGKRLLERPLTQVLKDASLDMPFCLCWANENWTRRWDGMEHEILMAQNHSPEDDLAFIQDIEPVLRDHRYIRIQGRPLLIVYRISLLPEPQATARRWRDYCINAGVGDLYLVAAQSFGIADPRPYGFDAAVEFPPHGVQAPCINEHLPIFNPDYRGNIYDYRYMVDFARQRSTPDYPLFRTVMPSWDNEARRPGRGNVFHHSTPDLYQSWLRTACEYSAALHKRGEQLVFINAWNEWAEGAHLEPDRRYGYAYLQATADVLRTLGQPHDEPLISVIMPAYNHEKFITAALESVATQTYQNLELIIVNDGSSDGTQEVINEFVIRHPKQRIQVRQQANAGSVVALHNGIQQASGDYIALINSDDLYEPGRIAWMLHTMQQAKAELAFTGVTFIDDDGAECGHGHETADLLRSKLAKVNDYPHLVYALLDTNIAVSTGNLMFTRRLYLEIGGFRDLRLCHDWDFVLQATCRTPVIRIEEPLYRYRIHRANTFTTLQDTAPEDVRKTLSGFFEALENQPNPVFASDLSYFTEFVHARGYDVYAGLGMKNLLRESAPQ